MYILYIYLSLYAVHPLHDPRLQLLLLVGQDATGIHDDAHVGGELGDGRVTPDDATSQVGQTLDVVRLEVLDRVVGAN